MKLTKKQNEIDVIFSPDKDGISEWISKEEISKNKTLDWGKNGASRHGIFFGDNRYKWQKYPLSGRIEKIRTIGYSSNLLYGKYRPIRRDIEVYHKKMGCVVCGTFTNLVTDHKNDLYNDKRVLNISKQNINDFQCLCTHCNLRKREVTKKTMVTKKRYKATNIKGLSMFGIDFINGDECFNKDDINAMVGTYWYDVIEFNKYIKSSLEHP